MWLTTHHTHRRSLLLSGIAVLAAVGMLRMGAVWANTTEPTWVITDTVITHSLVSMVMGDTGNPAVLIQGASSPHDHALRPSEAASLQSARLLIWTSHELTPWLVDAMDSLTQAVAQLELMNAPQTTRLAYRDIDPTGNAHSHEHGHDDTATDAHHEHGSVDPHGWLDPVNAIYWLDLIAAQLSELYPHNEAFYSNNTRAAQAQLRAQEQDIRVQLAEVANRPFVVFHDSYHYFEDRFDIHATASITLSDTQTPGIRRMNALRGLLKELPGACLFTEPQFSDRLVISLTRGMDVSLDTLDPLGANLQPGPELYPAVIQQIADTLHDCLSENTNKSRG